MKTTVHTICKNNASARIAVHARPAAHAAFTCEVRCAEHHEQFLRNTRRPFVVVELEHNQNVTNPKLYAWCMFVHVSPQTVRSDLPRVLHAFGQDWLAFSRPIEAKSCQKRQTNCCYGISSAGKAVHFCCAGVAEDAIWLACTAPGQRLQRPQ